MEGIGLKDVVTQVGDRYVVEEMRKNDYNFGGEQSGHMIFLDFNNWRWDAFRNSVTEYHETDR